MRSIVKSGALSLCVGLLSGCSYIRSITAPDDANLLSGAGVILKAQPKGASKSSVDGFEELDLDKLLADYGLDDLKKVATAQSNAAVKEDYKYRRNDLQERLIAASNQRCGTYLRLLVTSKSQTQMGWTGLATVLSGAAAVVPHAQTAKALAAGATVSTGMLSSYNEAYFNNLAVTVMASGIQKQRESMLTSLGSQRDKDLVKYPVNAAIADALAYHAACNIVVGMEAASRATNQADPVTFSPLRR